MIAGLFGRFNLGTAHETWCVFFVLVNEGR